ncbi:hypothetical protein C1H46_033146 [Malus baccata]|uniref:Uncharacterized protein n=1 Tax=Malus baccata TaxID=106549 RepID=A0A540L486_MALBA|nr:hypothetical protein C1H46_033146 [Malus baccata]
MATSARSTSTFRRQGSSGLIRDDKPPQPFCPNQEPTFFQKQILPRSHTIARALFRKSTTPACGEDMVVEAHLHLLMIWKKKTKYLAKKGSKARLSISDMC